MRLLTAFSRRLDEMLGIIQHRAIESAGFDGHQQLDRRQRAVDPRSLVAEKRVAPDFDHFVALDDPIHGRAVRLIAYPTHPLPPLQMARLSPMCRYRIAGGDVPA